MSDILNTALGPFDLDDDATYEEYSSLSNEELWQRFIRQVGYVYMYTHHFPHHQYFEKQWAEVERLCAEFGDARQERFGEGREGRRFLEKMLFKLEMETENMC